MSFPTRINLGTLVQDGYGYVIPGGRPVSGAGDVNDDGINDILIGYPLNDIGGGIRSGVAVVVYGQAGTTRTVVDFDTLGPTNGFFIQGDTLLEQSGFSVSNAGDVNGDGIDDLIIGTPYGGDGGSYAGEAYVIYGQAGATRGKLDLTGLSATNGFIIQGDDRNDNAGWSVSAAGDVNGDGFDDVIVGAPSSDSSGSFAGTVYVVYGKSGTTRGTVDVIGLASTDGFAIIGDTFSDRLGISVSAAGDINNDGFDDVIIGALGGDGGGSNAGEAYVIYGKTGTDRPALDTTNFTSGDGFIIFGDADNDQAGVTVSDAGDINGDGIVDMIVGAFGADDGGYNAGEVYVIYGKTGSTRPDLHLTGMAASDGFVIQGDAAYDYLGLSVSAAGDVNGDGLGDLIVGAPSGDNGGYNAGEAYVIFGKVGTSRTRIDLTTLSASDGFVIEGAGAYNRAGFGVSGVGDVNDDGVDDLIVSARDQSSYVIYGIVDSSLPTTGDDDLTGTTGADTINLGTGSDSYTGGDGNDTIVGGAGADTLNGDEGDDTFEFAAGDLVEGEEINGGAGIDTLVFTGGFHDFFNVTISGIERIVLNDPQQNFIAVADLATAALISAGNGGDDLVAIASVVGVPAGELASTVFALLNVGVNEVQYNTSVGTKSAGLQGAEMKVISPDGLDYTFAFAAGVVTTATAVDTMDIRTWSGTVTDYDATGAVTGRTITNDNGLINDIDYVNGVRAVQTMTDTLGVATYQTLTRTFDAAGALVQTSKLADNGVQVIVGAAVAQTLMATAANDVLTGGAGADVFVFGLGASRDKVTDFAVAEDMLDLTAFGIDSTADLFGTATVRQQGANTRIDIDDLVLTLVNVDRDDLTDANFVAIV